ncbi:MAG TPA: hypothetical protein VGB37_18420 [Candidatus Lokiarchaeia archaeon]
MVIREAGIVFRGFTLANASYHKVADEEIDQDLRSSLLSALLSFAESAFSTKLVEYFEMGKFIIAFIEDDIIPSDSPEPEILVSYAICDKQKKFDSYVRKIVFPSLKTVTQEFKARYDKKNLSEISQFKAFKTNLDTIFGSDTKTIEQKLQGTFFE